MEIYNKGCQEAEDAYHKKEFRAADGTHGAKCEHSIQGHVRKKQEVLKSHVEEYVAQSNLGNIEACEAVLLKK